MEVEVSEFGGIRLGFEKHIVYLGKKLGAHLCLMLYSFGLNEVDERDRELVLRELAQLFGLKSIWIFVIIWICKQMQSQQLFVTWVAFVKSLKQLVRVLLYPSMNSHQ